MDHFCETLNLEFYLSNLRKIYLVNQKHSGKMNSSTFRLSSTHPPSSRFPVVNHTLSLQHILLHTGPIF